jgi:hypothetical protein
MVALVAETFSHGLLDCDPTVDSFQPVRSKHGGFAALLVCEMLSVFVFDVVSFLPGLSA